MTGPRIGSISPGPWEVASGFTGELAVHNGLTVFASDGRAVANCANSDLPLAEQRANARAISAVPSLIRALEGAEDYIGDLPRNPQADVVYRDIANALGKLRHGGGR